VAGTELAREAGVTVEAGRPYVDKLVVAGYVNLVDGTLELTTAGHAAADQVFEARRQSLEHMPAGWSPEQHADLAQLLTRLSRELLGEDADRHLIQS